jgi:hypothetical protein
MPSITQFNDFMQSTGPAYLKSADAVINEAVKNNYVLSRLLKEKASETLVQGGTSVKDVIVFDDASTYQKYQPNDTFTWNNPQVTDTLTAPWRFSMDYMSWTDQEIELNDGDAKVMYKRLKRVKEMRMWTSMLNGMENDLWQSSFGNETAMEGSGGKEPYSLPSFITENATFTTLLGERGGNPYNSSGTRWTSVLGINPSNDPRWTNQISFYNKTLSLTDNPVTKAAGDYYGHNANASNTRTVFNLFGAFDDMYLKVMFKAPLTQRQYFEETTFQRQMILCSRLGMNQYKRTLRISNDMLVNPQDAAYNTPTFSGIPLEYCANLDDAAIFPAAASGTSPADTLAGRNNTTSGHTAAAVGTETGSGTIDKGARYYFINGQYLTPIFHTTRYMKKHDVMRHPNQPFTWVQPVDCWWNLFCNSRQRHGIIAPLLT